jgi:hypothetical protein
VWKILWIFYCPFSSQIIMSDDDVFYQGICLGIFRDDISLFTNGRTTDIIDIYHTLNFKERIVSEDTEYSQYIGYRTDQPLPHSGTLNRACAHLFPTDATFAFSAKNHPKKNNKLQFANARKQPSCCCCHHTGTQLLYCNWTAEKHPHHLPTRINPTSYQLLKGVSISLEHRDHGRSGTKANDNGRLSSSTGHHQ